jgi:uncharacterized membrane protein
MLVFIMSAMNKTADHPPSHPAPARRIYPRWLFVVICAAVVLHLNYWLWAADRLVWGLPINLFYHVVLTLTLAVVMTALVRKGWPSFLDDDEDGE